MTVSKALCILDGGLNSTICAALACQRFDEVHAVICKDGQQSVLSLESAIAIAEILNLTSYEIIDLSAILGGAQRSAQAKETYQSAYPLPCQPRPLSQDEQKFVSAPDILALTSAANVAAVMGIKDVFIDACQIDTNDPDMNYQALIDSLAEVLGKAMWRDPNAFVIHTPLMHLSRAEHLKLAIDVLGEQFQSVLEFTHDCSTAAEGGCGHCYDCLMRDQSFWEAGIEDPIWKFRYAQTNKFVNTLSKIHPDLARL